ncbi:MAG TPA: KTSC domain-containing protein, partial [Burkholderiaceae bacterium]
MEMKRLSGGKLRAAGYDAKERVLRVELDDGTAVEYGGVGAEVWRKLSTSAAAWSYYRDHIEEEFHGKKSRVLPKARPQELDDLFGGPPGDTAT